MKKKNIFKFLTILLTTITKSATAEKTLPTHFGRELTIVRAQFPNDPISPRIIDSLNEYHDTLIWHSKNAIGETCEPTLVGQIAIETAHNELTERLDEDCSNLKYTVLETAKLWREQPEDSDLRSFYSTLLLLTVPQCKRSRY